MKQANLLPSSQRTTNLHKMFHCIFMENKMLEVQNLLSINWLFKMLVSNTGTQRQTMVLAVTINYQKVL